MHRTDFEVLFKRNPLPMWMFDRETLAFVEVNEAAVHHYGYSRSEFLAMRLSDIRPSEDVDELHRALLDPAQLTEDRTWRHRRKDGSIIHVQIRATEVEDGGRALRLVVVNDLTELRRATEQLRQAQKMEALGRLAGGIAHDFNNVLTVIHSYAGLLESDLDAADVRRQDATEIRLASERASAITRQLLTMSRGSAVEHVPLRLHEVVAGFTSMLRRALGEQITLDCQITEVPPVLADRGQMEQVLMNLAVNARDAMPGCGRLIIETRVVADHVELAVTDTGAGMDADTQRHIFDPFFTTKGAGTGLGLSIVHGIVAQAGGTITVYSEPGHGTTFRVRLPITQQEAAPEAAPAASLPALLTGLTVIVVDDNVEVRMVAARILRDEGCTVLEAGSGADARRICVSYDGAIDVAIVDYFLPDDRGDLLADHLRELRPALATLMSSGYPAGALSARGAVPSALLGKPFGPRELRAAVARAAASRLEGEAVEDAAGEMVLVTAAEAAHGPRVLIVDDEPLVRRTLSTALRASGCNPLDACDGRQARQRLASHSFDVVISDVHMPDGDGIDVMRAVRAVDLDLPIILMSGAPDFASAAAAVELGAFRYLTKPIDYAQAIKLIKHAARAHALARLRREAFELQGAPAQARDRIGLEVGFERALEGLWMAYQPIIEARTGALFGVEALMRSDEPSMAGPQALLDAATRLQELPRLGRRVRAQTAADVAVTDERLQIFVNLHPEELHDVELISSSAPLSRIARRVVLECTERAALHSSQELTDRIDRLRALGFKLAVDDLGAGYSGLTSFTQLTPELVKLDMSLVRDVHLSHVKRRTIRAVCELCHEVGSLVVGEGVETVDERDCLIDLGCDLLQGYLVGRPARGLPSAAR